jgi:hypothetical protein
MERLSTMDLADDGDEAIGCRRGRRRRHGFGPGHGRADDGFMVDRFLQETEAESEENRPGQEAGPGDQA